MKRWCFTEHEKRPPVWWSWRAYSAEGAVEHVSDGFKTYGAAVVDAIRNGFRPSDDHWIVETAQAVVHFAHGRHAVSISMPGKAPARRTSNAAVPVKDHRLPAATAGKRRAPVLR